MISSETSKKFSLFMLVIAFIAFIYMTVKVIGIVDKTQVGTSAGIYTSYISSDEEIKEKSKELTQKCSSELCKVQKLLDFVTHIPYKTNIFQQNSVQKTIQENFGDCDDKSNLLISMLHALGIEAYFVLVPKHIFVIVPLEENTLSHRKGIWVNGKKYYILESTAKDSRVGYPLKYELNEIDVIIEPFSNEKVDIKVLTYKL